MKKEIRDGNVAVLYSPGFGAGWYTWHGLDELLFDPSVVYMVEEKQKSNTPEDFENWVSNITDYCKQTYGDDHYYGGADDLIVEWINEGTLFRIDEYDGSESLDVKEDMPWIKA
jgi:hypothetical protein